MYTYMDKFFNVSFSLFWNLLINDLHVAPLMYIIYPLYHICGPCMWLYMTCQSLAKVSYDQDSLSLPWTRGPKRSITVTCHSRAQLGKDPQLHIQGAIKKTKLIPKYTMLLHFSSQIRQSLPVWR